MPFEFTKGDLEDVLIVDPEVFEDERGVLVETYLEEDFRGAGIDADFIQDKYSCSESGVLRGLHYQTGEFAQAKLVRCAAGVVLDVIVDLRTDSSTFGEYSANILTESNNRMVYQPRGFAHGYLVLSESARFHYKLDNTYAPEREAGIRWDDPTLDIDWPVDDPVLSQRDETLPTFEWVVENEMVF